MSVRVTRLVGCVAGRMARTVPLLFVTVLGNSVALAGPAQRRPSIPRTGDVLSKAAPRVKVADWKSLFLEATRTRYKGKDIVMVSDDQTVRVEPSGVAHRTRRRIYKLLTEKGAARVTVQRFDYDPRSNRVEIRSVRKVTKRGDLVQWPHRVWDMPQPAHWILWGGRMKVLSMPRVRAGEGIEVITDEKGFRIAYLAGRHAGRSAVRAAVRPATAGGDERFVPPMRGQFDDVVLFGNQPWPVLFQRYEVSLPPGKRLQFGLYNGAVAASLEQRSGRTIYAWWARNLPAHKHEKMAPDDWDFLPKVVLSTVPSWEVKSRWFYHVNEHQFEADAAIRTKVTKLLRGIKGDRARFAVLTRWVAHHIRYRGLSMGKGEGYTLHRGTTVFHDRVGVCKDMASMLITMLKAAGYRVSPAMTMAGARVESVPADQFNHCVVAVDRGHGRYWMLDPTWAPHSRLLWSNAERGQYYLVGSPRGETFMRTPVQGPKENRLSMRMRSVLSKGGTLSGTLHLTGTGYMDTRLRRYLVYGRNQTDRDYAWQKMVTAAWPKADVVRTESLDPNDLDHGFWAKLTLRLPHATTGGPRVRLLQMPVFLAAIGRMGKILQGLRQSKRTQPLLLWMAHEVSFRNELRLPTGWRAVGLPIHIRKHSAAGSLDAAVVAESGKLVVTYRFTVAKRQMTAAQFRGLHDAFAALDGLARRRLLLERTGRRPKGGVATTRRAGGAS
ncbi:MAG: DUF3857 domain-containing protein [Deltaproteobacteria bacterium]|nr:DUF3857 domain-containing protein [Deltaproteobacteria bacterium]